MKKHPTLETAAFAGFLVIAAIALIWVLTALVASPASAQQQSVGYYHTGNVPVTSATGATGVASVTGTENAAVVSNNNGSGSLKATMIAALSYNTGASEVAMAFDAKTLPANGAIPIMECPLGTAAASTAPVPCSFDIPPGGVPLTAGLVVACSTTGLTLTVDTHAGGFCYFEVTYSQ